MGTKNHLKIVADMQILGVEKLFGNIGELVQVKACDLTPRLLQNANILLVRSVTQVDEKLLADSAVQWVGTATSGLDHLDQSFLRNQRIPFADAAGGNAQAVAEYVLSCVASLKQHGFLGEKKLRAGVIGVGRVGRVVVQQLQKIGFEVIQNDPPRAKKEADFVSVDLQDWKNLDLICMHTPLTTDGDFPSYHLIDKDFLNRQKLNCVLINAGRGAVIREQDLLACPHIVSCLDVWENEPVINLELLKKCQIATPHIAGYSVQAKFRATWMLYEQARMQFNWPEKPMFIPERASVLKKNNWEEMALASFDPFAYTQTFRQVLLENADNCAIYFEKMRNEFPLRWEFLTNG